MGFSTARLLVGLAVVVSACGTTAPPVAIPSHLEPASVDLAVGPDQAAHVLRVRIYAGAAYRARVVGWEADLADVVAASSAILQEACGARIEVVESLDWKLAGGNLSHALASLVAFDRALDVDLAIGLIDAAPEAEDDYALLVDAQLLGRHAVVRSFNRLAESERLQSETASLDESSKEALLDRRRRHKQAFLVAHAVAKAFGAEASSPYMAGDTRLSNQAGAILKLTIPTSLAAAVADADTKSIWGEAAAKLEALGVPPELMESVRLLEAGTVAGAAAAPEELDTLRAVDRDTLASAKELLESGSAAKAWEVLEPLTELYPKHSVIAELACQVAFARSASDALDRCRNSTTGRPQSAQSWLRVGRLLLESEPAAALPALRKAGALLTAEDSGWVSLASAYRKLSLPSLAIEAAARAKNPKDVASTLLWAQETRSRYGSDVGVDPAAEGRYLIALQAGLKLVYKNDFKAANVAAEDLRSSFPQSIAGDLMQCEIAVRRRKYDAAKRSCELVLSRQEANAWSRYLLGVVSLREKDEAKAIEYWSAAISRDLGLKAAYEGLAKIYRKSSDVRLDALKAQYKSHFGSELR